MLRSVNVGSDKVTYEGDRLIVHAAVPMDWPVREFCKVPIFFLGRKYYVRAKRPDERPHAMVYELWPWPEDLHESSSQAVVYDAAYVANRDRTTATERKNDWSYLLLVPFYPFLGLCWSGFKTRMLSPMGFEPGSITKASVALTFNLFLLEAVFVGWLAGGAFTHLLSRPGLRPLDWLLLILLGADSVIRFSQSLRMDVERHWGFCEWLRPENDEP